MPVAWNRINISREILWDFYENQRLSLAQIALELNCSTTPIQRLLKEYNIKVRTVSDAREKFKISKKELKYFYKVQKLSTAQIAKKYGCNHVTVVNRMKKYRIQSRGHLGLTKPINISKEKLEYLYRVRGLSMEKIAKILHRSKGGIERRIRYFEIKTRDINHRACKYKKKNFSGNPIEKAYLIGFRLGDLNVAPTKNLIQARCSTTQNAQVVLIRNLFSPYTTPYIQKAKRGTYEIVALLNKSFGFLLPKKDEIERWILKRPQYFWAFFAGYADAEGSFYLKKSTRGKKRPVAMFEIQTQDKQIIHQLWNGLNKFGIISPEPKISRPGGTIDKRGKKNNRDMWRIEVGQKVSIWKMLNVLKPLIKHKGKKTALSQNIDNIVWRNNLPYSQRIYLEVPGPN